MENKPGLPEDKKQMRFIHVNTPDSSKSQIKLSSTKDSEGDQSKKTLADYVPPNQEDPSLDKVIDDIIMSEGNEVLAAEDSMYDSSEVKRPKKKSRLAKLNKLLKNKWFYVGLAVVLIAIFSVPDTRYLILGAFIKKDYKLTVVDSVTNIPVSDVAIKVGKQNYSTNASGQAVLKLNLGSHEFSLSKKYYALDSGHIFVGFSSQESTTVKLSATGRPVEITVINKLSNRPLAGVNINIVGTSATTNSVGQAQLVLPTKKASYDATITANSFNALTTPIQVTTNMNANVISLVPAGSIFYLSNTTGTINVIKANLDGSDPVVELAGTGQETPSTTLLPSPDWKYLVLEAERTGSQPELYVINTSNGNITEFDSAADSFKLIGWSNDEFIYDEIASSQDPSTFGREEIKSYNAASGQLNTIDEDQVLGSSPSYAYQSFANFELLPNLLIYTTSWSSVGSYDVSSSNDTIRGVEPNGVNKKDYTSFQASTTGAMNIVQNTPQSLYISVVNSSTNQTSYYTYTNGAVSSVSISASSFSTSYPTYFISPAGTATLWNSQNNQIYIGNQNGQNGKRLIVPSGFSAYGWYDNIYVLLEKNGQLYIAPATGSNNPIVIGSIFTPQ